MGAAFVGVDVVGEREFLRVVAVVPLQRDLGVDAVAIAAHVDRLLVDDAFVLVQVLDERDDAAVVMETMVLAVAFVVEGDGHAGVEERELAQALSERVEAELRRLEDLRVGLERDFRAALLRRAGDDKIGLRRPALVGLLVDLFVAPDLELEALGQRIDHRHADAVQAARDLVAVVVELAAGMEHGEHDFRGRATALVHVGRDAAAVVDDGDRVVDVNGDVDLAREAGQRFVDGVVDDLVDEMMQPGRPGRADVHRRPLAHRLEAFEDLDAFCAVLVAVRAVVDSVFS